ncbi:DNA mismatch endonuclease Vsr [Sphingomonas sp. BT-65]|uniref:very short patch repair endonuclease n=1 Tax=Sphingomonas sp. BT-65 TaxID=2989821 RepID=UPI002236AAED|nr:DNA mismatch endonuclease Vsr [Sphingomonas sp. BT-65]MCW4460828.1 DNA mismatch endonuclease Vsr [Sphingomonas sp. BT-65]
MADTFDTEKRSAIMRAVRSADTRPELVVRSLLHRAGYRFRLHRKNLPGRPDLVFPARRKVIFIHGCFWHSHRDPSCRRARVPKSRTDYWSAKLEANEARDKAALERLQALGWEALVIWECELRDTAATLACAAAFLDSAR